MTKKSRQRLDNDARKFAESMVDRMDWILRGHFPEPPDWEKPTVIAKMEAAVRGDDNALAWLKRRFSPDHSEPLQ